VGIAIGVLVGPILWILPQKHRVSFAISYQLCCIMITIKITIMIISVTIETTIDHFQWQIYLSGYWLGEVNPFLESL
jgi:hypothetical protein